MVKRRCYTYQKVLETKMSKKVYKVVRTSGKEGAFTSCINGNRLTLARCGEDEVPARIYRIGKVTRSVRGSLGLFCFEVLEDALGFGSHWEYRILLVEGIGKGIKPGRIDFSYFHPHFRRGVSFNSPLGTVCFLAVKVLKEYKK